MHFEYFVLLVPCVVYTLFVNLLQTYVVCAKQGGHLGLLLSQQL